MLGSEHGDIRRLALTDADAEARRRIEEGFFTTEEGIRFGTDPIGFHGPDPERRPVGPHPARL